MFGLPVTAKPKLMIFYSARRYCDHASLFVGRFVCSFVCYDGCDFSKNTSAIFMKFVADV